MELQSPRYIMPDTDQLLSGAREALHEFAAMPPGDVTVLSGAGVSVEGPSSLPTGWELTERAFSAFFLPGTLAAIQAAHAAVGWFDAPACPTSDPPKDSRLPRLETVLGVAARVHGRSAVDVSLADVATAEPNRLHHFLAQHLGRDGGHLTANFDLCVERAAQQRGLAWSDDDLFHFHGEIGGVAELGVTLARIEGGFPSESEQRFLALLIKRPAVLVVGYSGSDFFDVNTAIAGLPPESLGGRRVVWLSYSQHHPHVVSMPALESDAPDFTLFDILRRKGADLTVLCGPPEFALRELARHWGFSPMEAAVARSPAAVRIDVDVELRPLASHALHLEIGLFDEVTALAGQVSPLLPRTQAWSATSAALWEAGRWNAVRRLWLRARPRSDTTRLERIGASLWVQGRLLPAFLWLNWHRRRAHGADRKVLAEIEGRVLEHMLRTPDLRWLARRLVPAVRTELGQPGRAIGVHLYRRRSDLASSLAELSGEQRERHHARTTSEWFGQAGNVLGWITYEHRRLRDTYRDDDDDAQLDESYRRQQRLYAAAGSRSGALRTHLLPGAHRVFTVREVLLGVFALQYGWWQRFRVVMRHAAKRLRWRWTTRRSQR